jgi:hypothetical protein
MAKQSLYIKAKGVIGRLWKNQPREVLASSQPVAYYLSCNQLPLDRFIRVMIDGDLSALIISGKPTDGQLAEAWANMYIEYLELNKSNDTAYINNIERDISLLADELNRVSDALVFLYSPAITHIDQDVLQSFSKTLSKYGYKIDFSVDSKTYLKQLKVIENRKSSRELEYTRKMAEYNEYMKDKENMTIDRSYFNRMLNRLGKHYNCFIEDSKITVARFVDMIQQYFSDLQQKQQRMEDVKHG